MRILAVFMFSSPFFGAPENPEFRAFAEVAVDELGPEVTISALLVMRVGLGDLWSEELNAHRACLRTVSGCEDWAHIWSP